MIQSPFGPLQPGLFGQQPQAQGQAGVGSMLPAFSQPRPTIPSAFGDVSPEMLAALSAFSTDLQENREQADKDYNRGVGGSILSKLFTKNPFEGFGDVARHQTIRNQARRDERQGELQIAQAKETARTQAGNQNFRDYEAKLGDWEWEEGEQDRELKRGNTESLIRSRNALTDKRLQQTELDKVRERDAQFLLGLDEAGYDEYMQRRHGFIPSAESLEATRRYESGLDARVQKREDPHEWLHGMTSKVRTNRMSGIPKIRETQEEGQFGAYTKKDTILDDERRQMMWHAEFEDPTQTPIFDMREFYELQKSGNAIEAAEKLRGMEENFSDISMFYERWFKPWADTRWNTEGHL